MKIDLSPGEWAGVLDVLKLRAKSIRAYADATGDPQDDELADDYERIAGIIREALASDPLAGPGRAYDHEARPDDDPEPGDRCKDCGEPITWTGPSPYSWLHVGDARNR